jgi:hypothetical protein
MERPPGVPSGLR